MEAITPAEQALLDLSGDTLDLRISTGTVEHAVSVSRWDVTRTISAELLGEVIRERESGSASSHLRIRGGLIVGELNLDSLNLTKALYFEGCRFTGDILLSRLRVPEVGFDQCVFPSVLAPGIETTWDLCIASCLGCRVDIRWARIDGSLDLHASTLSFGDGVALDASGAHVRRGLSGLFLRTDGQVLLINAHFNSSVSLCGAVMHNANSWALNAQGMKVDYALFLGSSIPHPFGFTADGGLRLIGVAVQGFVSMRDARVTAAMPRWYALVARDLRVSSNWMMSGTFHLRGGAHLLNAQVGAEIDLKGAQIETLESAGFRALHMVVGDSVQLTESTNLRGKFDFSDSRVTRSVDFSGADLSNVELVLEGLQAHELRLLPTAAPASLNLSHANVDVLIDEPKTWPQRIQLAHFVYGKIARAHGEKVQDRLDWLARDLDGFAPGPYEQLAGHYRSVGDEQAMRSVQIAKLKKRRGTLDWFSRLLDRIFYWLVGYGYQSWRAALWLVLILFVGWFLFGTARPDELVALKSSPDPFSPLMYTVDSLVPIVNFGQRDSWRVTGPLLILYRTDIVAGWVLTTATVAAVTARLRRDS